MKREQPGEYETYMARNWMFLPGVRRFPALVVDIDAETHEVLAVTPVSGSNAWGRLPMPNF